MCLWLTSLGIYHGSPPLGCCLLPAPTSHSTCPTQFPWIARDAALRIIGKVPSRASTAELAGVVTARVGSTSWGLWRTVG